MAEATEETPCEACGDEIGMDAGHHVMNHWHDGQGGFYHWDCRAAMLEAERDEARAALAACVRYQYGVNDMNGWEEAAAAWTEARRIVALST